MLLSVFHLTGLPGWSCPNFSHQRSSGAESRTGSTHFPTKTAGIAPQNLLFPKFESQLSVAIWGGNAKNSLIQNLPSKKLQLLWTLVLKIVTLSQMQWWKWGKTGFKQSSYDFRRDLLQGLGGKLTFTVEKSDVSEKWDANQPQRETDIVKERRKMTTDKMKSSMGSNQKETENNYKRRKMAEETPKRKRNKKKCHDDSDKAATKRHKLSAKNNHRKISHKFQYWRNLNRWQRRNYSSKNTHKKN